uniref:Uncharacterized protein n=1 Tax=Triticum urartu TaxID=4572 RepID=A0A8R7U3H2_TRIUA
MHKNRSVDDVNNIFQDMMVRVQLSDNFLPSGYLKIVCYPSSSGKPRVSYELDYVKDTEIKGSYTGCFFGNYKSASIIYRHQRNMLLEKVQRCGEQQVVSSWWSPSATMVCSPWHRESAWDVVEGRGGGVALRARCELNDVASRGGDSEKLWWAEHARELKCECDRCIVR